METSVAEPETPQATYAKVEPPPSFGRVSAFIENEQFLKQPCVPVKDLAEGLEIGRRLLRALDAHNKKAFKKHVKSHGKNSYQTGVGLAANQIGILKQVCVIQTGKVPLVLINPRIVACSETSVPFSESCLSFPGLKVETERRIWVEVESMNHPGRLVFGPKTPEEWTGSSLLKSIVVQHEVSHLAGLTMWNFSKGETPPAPTEWFAGESQ